MNEKKVQFAFTIKKQIEKVTETKSTNAEGNEVTVSKKIKTVEPVNFRLLKPTRKLHQRAELFNAKTVSAYMMMGLISITLVAKRFGNDGGPLTDTERELLNVIEERTLQLEKEFYSLSASKDEKDLDRRAELAAEIVAQRERQANIQNAYLSLFENTAEMKARKKLIDWWVSNIVEKEVEVKDADGKVTRQFVPIVDGKDDEEKIDALYDLMDSGDEFNKEIADKCSYLVSYWFNSVFSALGQSDFENVERMYERDISGQVLVDDLAPKEPAAAIEEAVSKPTEEKPVNDLPVAVKPQQTTPTDVVETVAA